MSLVIFALVIVMICYLIKKLTDFYIFIRFCLNVMTARICFIYSNTQKTWAKCFSVNKTLFIFTFLNTISCLHCHVYCQHTLLQRLVYENLSTAMVLNVIWDKGCQFLKIFLHTDHYAGNKMVEQWYIFGMKFGNKHWHKPLRWHCCSSETQDHSEATAWSRHEVPPKVKKNIVYLLWVL